MYWIWQQCSVIGMIFWGALYGSGQFALNGQEHPFQGLGPQLGGVGNGGEGGGEIATEADALVMVTHASVDRITKSLTRRVTRRDDLC